MKGGEKSAKPATLRTGRVGKSAPQLSSVRCHGNDDQQSSACCECSKTDMPRITLLPDQLYEENAVLDSEDSEEGLDDFREQYAREVRKIRENIRAIRRIKAKSSRSSASSSLPRNARASAPAPLRNRSVSCWQLEQQRPQREKGKMFANYLFFIFGVTNETTLHELE
ncbi:uncharacterized protein CDAR_486411 [Caerostris darwini]|uniref:Uncharacterized protein n=1 Tax=Caerostris darwini TaxID=1538125 RepID=A0AAV4MBC4_9ARAC|nr:uncharacterized protein CDAR_486411 [Caerostris darwini]